MSDRVALNEEFARCGRIWLRNALPASELDALRCLSDVGGRPGVRISRGDPRFDVLANGAVSARLQALWPGMQAVRLLAFDKQPAANWGVPWHQDRVVAVKARAETPGYEHWSQKSGAWHCEPPVAVLEQMRFVRVHLDANTADNGAMQIALGSHRLGKVAEPDIAETVASCEIETTEAQPGDVLVLAMLTLHRSGPSTSATPRQVLRIDYASEDLPAPLEWA